MRGRRIVSVSLGLALAATASLLGPAAVGAPAEVPPPTPPTAAARTVDPEHTAAYVQAVYDDLFGRLPDAAGTSYWTRALLSGTPRAAVANSITSSEEFRSGLIVDAYDEFLGRGPDAGGLRYWLDQMARGMTIARLESGFIASDEFWALSGYTAAGWVADLYGAVLGRDPAPSEVSYWVGRLAGGASRGQVALGFLLSTERLTTVVNGYYQWLLGRDLDPSGQRTWVGILQAGGRDETIIGGIVGSEEYWDLVTAAVDVVALKIVPPYDPIPAGPDVPFTVLGLDASGRAVVDLSDVATLDRDGGWWLCVASVCDMRTSAGPHTMTASVGALTSSVVVNVGPGALASLVVRAPFGYFVAGEPIPVRVLGYDASSNEIGPAEATLTVDGGTCTGTTCTATSAGVRTIHARAGEATGWVQVTVNPAAPASLALNPLSATIPLGAGVAFDLTGRDRFGNVIRTDLLSTTTFTVDGSDSACTRGVCSPLAEGAHTVRATNGAATTTATLNVTPPGPTAARLFGWGRGVGDGSETTVPLSQIGVDTHWRSVAAGPQGEAGITTDGSLWVWGAAAAIAADGSAQFVRAPRRISNRADWAHVAVGNGFGAAIADDGSLWAWGDNGWGSIPGAPRTVSEPVRIGSRADWVAVAAEGYVGLALAADGSLWSWGPAWDGALGRAASSEPDPAPVEGGHQWQSVDAAGGRVLAIASDGTMWTWGQGTPTPTQVGSDAGWQSASAGSTFSLAIRTDHTLWSWGTNANGQLGLGDLVDRATPTQIGIGTTWAQAAAASGAGYALTTTGELWGWGPGSSQASTSGPVADPTSPVRIGTESGWTAVVSGGGWFPRVFALRP